MRISVRSSGLLRAALLVAAAAACAPGARPSAGVAPGTDAVPAPRRILVVSFDALAERRLLETVDSAAAPTFRAMFREGACAASARPAFPSVTAPGHSAIWTGAYGNVTGVSANAQPWLPRSEHTLLQTLSGYDAQASRAEPLWIAAGAAGFRVAGHHVTQAPDAPGYLPLDARGADPRLDSLRAAARRTLDGERVAVLNGYNVQVSPTVMLSERTAPPRAPGAWAGLDRLTSGVPPREIAWAAGQDSLFGLLHGGARYDRVLVAPVRDVARGTVARLAPVEHTEPVGRPLARHFAEWVPVETSRGPSALTARLFALSSDGARYELLVPELRVVEANRPAVAAAYRDAVGGWVGNGAGWLTRGSAFGRAIADGGDGTAELRYLETLELLTRQFIRGSDWLWRTHRPALQLEYLPLIDEVDHTWYGHVDPASPLHDPAVAARIQPMRARAYRLADLRLAALRALTAGDPGAALVVTGDHGMRALWRTFRPNVALREAGLLAVDSAGRIDLSRTRALSPNGYFVVVNRTTWKGGIVPPDEVLAVREAAARALAAARGADGQPIVRQLWRTRAEPGGGSDSLGIGGPTGGDVYYELAPGYSWTAQADGPVGARAPRPSAGHGFPSVAPDMQTALCLWGDGVPARRVGPLRNADAALIAADWLGAPRPAQAIGTSPLPALLGRPAGR